MVVTVVVVNFEHGCFGILLAGVASEFVLVVPRVFLRQIRRGHSLFW